MAGRIVITFAFAVSAGAGVAFPPPPKDTKPDADKLAKALGDDFTARLAKADYDAILKTIQFPYRTVAGKDTNSPKEVREDFTAVLAAYWSDDTTVAVKEVVAPDRFETWASALPLKPEASKTEAACKSVLEHVGPGGRIVAIQFTIDGKKDDDLCLLLVKIKDGKAVLVGLVD
jgi:hypothetical protein